MSGVRDAAVGGVEQADFHNITLIVDGSRDASGWPEVSRIGARSADRVGRYPLGTKNFGCRCDHRRRRLVRCAR